ncbi:aminotransferase class V-fold PLP-dependent enzyme [Eggerthellaceae bacterium zg-887]|uniref:aminotransferase class V-fold PLP-dependent enzyme n=1 Tax=Xiamenia xianingshaonis TaxID=2682776 RepID=UPI00140914D8|nr:aminotransferase class V-fold PLP-dependent enzyme [Xiamenia xianingshaonis]NHM16561.1 aminotransferase class V-fold PLP-dependent enzyme [Xiamenia xianingshaonis]
MIGAFGAIPMNDYCAASRALDDAEPRDMGAVAAVVFADLSTRPFAFAMDPAAADVATDEEIDAFRAKFEQPDADEPVALPLQHFEGEPLIRHVVRNLFEAGVGSVAIVCEAGAAMERLREAAGDARAGFFAYDAKAVAQREGFDVPLRLEGFTQGEILWAAERLREAAGETGLLPGRTGAPERIDSLLLMYADEAGVRVRHLKKLRAAFEESPDADFAVVYTEFRPMPPVLFSAAFLQRLAALRQSGLSGGAACEGTPVRPVLPFNVKTAIMGEERLAEYTPLPDCVAKDEADLPASALAAVRGARRPADRFTAVAARLKGEQPEEALERAQAFLARLDASVSHDPIAELDRWDAWAVRNRADFPFFSAPENAGVAYLDSAATALQPHVVIAKHVQVSSTFDGNVWRGMYAASARSTAAYQEAREKVAAFLGAEPREVVFTANTTHAVNLAARGWAAHRLRPGDVVLVAENEHHSNLVPWMQLAQDAGLRLRFIPLDSAGRIDMAAYRELLRDGAALVCVAHVSNVLGIENPIASMAELAHRAGARILVDAAQSAPHVAIDVNELGADFLALSGHKTFGPTGIGVLWVRRDVMAEMRPVATGGGTVSEVSFEGVYHRQTPYCFEAGTPPYEQAICLGEAVDYMQRLGMGAMRGHVRAMTRYALRALSFCEGATVLGDQSADDGSLGIVSFAVDGISNETLCALLARMQVANRAGAHCALPFVDALGVPGICRMSIGPYTTKEDIEAWAFAIQEAKRACAGMRERN